MNYRQILGTVKQVLETSNIQEVNELIENGWFLLRVAKAAKGEVLFSLGRTGENETLAD